MVVNCKMNKTYLYVRPILRNLRSLGFSDFLILLASVKKFQYGFIDTKTDMDKDSLAISIDNTQNKEEVQNLVDMLQVNDLLYGQVKGDVRILNIKIPIEGFSEVKARFLASEYSKMYENVDVSMIGDDGIVPDILTKSKEGLEHFYKKLLSNNLITEDFEKEELMDGREYDFPIEKQEEFLV